MRQSAYGLLDSHTGWAGWEATAHGPGDAVTVPDAQLLFGGEYKRAGTNLILSDETNRFVVRDYFRGEHRPTLLSPEGARLSADVVAALTGHGAYAQAGATSNAVVAVGRVAKVEGSATIVRNGVAIAVNTGDAVLKGDVLQTGAGVLGVTFVDGSTLSLTANSRLMVDDFVYDSNGSANSEVLNLVQGSLSFISGEVAHTGGNMKITTPVATMGIRGTVGGVTQASDGTVSFFVVESATGAVVTDNAGHVLFQVVQDGPLIQVRPAGPLQVIAEEVQKSPQELAVELAILQQIVNTQAVGQQIIQHFQDLQNDQGPHSTGTDHTQIQIDIPKSAFTDAGTGGAATNTQSASNTATVTTTTTDQNGTTTTTHDQVPFESNPPPANTGTPLQWTGASDDNNADNSANWNPKKSPTSVDDVIIANDHDENPAIVAANGPFAVHSLTLSEGAQLLADSVTVGGDLAIFGDGSATEISGHSPLTIHSVGGNLLVQATASDGNNGDAKIIASDHVTIGPIIGAFTVEADVPVDQRASAHAAILAAGHDLTIGTIGGSFLLSATNDGGGDAVADITAGIVTIGDVGHNFTITGGADSCSPAFAEISATCGDVDIGNIVGDFLNQGLIDAEHGTLSIGTVGGSFTNDGIMHAYELQIANGNAPLDNYGTIIATSLHNFGTIEATHGGSIYFGSGVLDNCGTVEAHSGGTVDFNHWVGGNGTLAMDGGTIELASGTCNTIDFSGTSGGNLVLDCVTASLGQITKFGPDDSIDLYHLNDVSIVGYTADSCNTGTLELNSCTTGNFYLSFTGDGTNYTVDNFVLSSDGNCGTQIIEAPTIDVLNQVVNNDSETNVTTVTDFKIVEPFDADEPLTITAVATHDAMLAFGSNRALGTISETATLDEINTVLHNGIVYTPGTCTPDVDSISLRIASDHGSETLNLMFKVAQTPGGVTLTATSGNDVMYGTESCDTFVFDNSQSGHDVVDHFDASHDVLQFDSSIFATICEALASAHDDIHGNAVITTAQNNTVTLDHVSAAALNSSNIAIHSNGFG